MGHWHIYSKIGGKSRHKQGTDDFENFALVAKMNTIRILLAFAVQFNWTLHQFDVKNAFLHGDLEEVVYMEPPSGGSLTDIGKDKLCKL